MNLEEDMGIAESYRQRVLRGENLSPMMIEWFEGKVRSRMVHRGMEPLYAKTDVVGSFALGFSPELYDNHLWLLKYAKDKAARSDLSLRKENV